ncbi:MAG: ATP-binding protein [Cyclobacteriaceae bacterium]
MKEKVSFDWIKKNLFSDEKKVRQLKKGDMLFDQDQKNDRLYLVNDGKFNGYFTDQTLVTYPIFEAAKNKFIGVYSYFSEDNKSYCRVVATEDASVSYYDKPLKDHSDEEWIRLAPFIISLVVNELYSRQHFARMMATEKYQDVQKLLKAEKMATLGQMAAGLAHELNNSIGMLDKGTDHLREFFIHQFQKKEDDELRDFFMTGCEEGQKISSEDARKLRAAFEKIKGLSKQQIKRMSRIGIDPNLVQKYLRRDPDTIDRIYASWESGCNLHDMRIAARHATQVVRSVKQLGVSEHSWSDHISVNDSIEEALVILKNLTKKVKLRLELDDNQPPTSGYYGQLIQVWINIIKNGLESMLSSKTSSPLLVVRSSHDKDHIVVEVTDHGPGIPKKIMERIFEPSFTTKIGGLSFGLGLGLSIVQRIITEHDGLIEVSSSSEKTTFLVKIPLINPNG